MFLRVIFRIIWNINGFGQVFGLAAAPDITEDGVGDITIATRNGQALLLSGADGSTVWSYTIGNGSLDQAAEVVALLPDLDGNNAPEIAVGSRHGELALLVSTGSVIVADEPGAAAESFALAPAYPNPFTDVLTVRFTLAAPAPVTLTVYDVLGRNVRRLVGEDRAAGSHSVQWDGRTASGSDTAAGVYLLRLEAGGEVQTRRVTRLR